MSIYFSIRNAQTEAQKRYHVHIKSKGEGYPFKTLSGLPAVLRRLDSPESEVIAKRVITNLFPELPIFDLAYYYEVQIIVDENAKEVVSLIINGRFINSEDIVELIENRFDTKQLARNLVGIIWKEYCADSHDRLSHILIKAVELAISPKTAALLIP